MIRLINSGQVDVVVHKLESSYPILLRDHSLYAQLMCLQFVEMIKKITPEPDLMVVDNKPIVSYNFLIEFARKLCATFEDSPDTTEAINVQLINLGNNFVVVLLKSI
jgi:hypothetical protein